MSGQSTILDQAKTGEIILRASTQLPIIRDTAKLLQTTSPKRQRRTKLQRKIQITTKKVVLLVLWRRLGTYN
jgi:hypothetical protein